MSQSFYWIASTIFKAEIAFAHKTVEMMKQH